MGELVELAGRRAARAARQAGGGGGSSRGPADTVVGQTLIGQTTFTCFTDGTVPGQMRFGFAEDGQCEHVEVPSWAQWT